MTPDAPRSDHTQAIADRRMPGVGAAAAVLGFVEAGLGLVLVVYVLVTLGSPERGGPGAAGAVLLVAIAISLLLLLGGLFLVRGTGRRLLIGTSIAEVVVVLGLGVWALAVSSPVYGPVGSGGDRGPVVAVLASMLVGIVLPVVRLSLAAQPAVGSWLLSRPPARPVWSPETQQWVTAPRGGGGVVLALLAPVVLVLLATVLVLMGAVAPVHRDLAITMGPAYGAVTWDFLYDGGDPVEPPTTDDSEFQPEFDDDAQDCFDGDLGACDDLYSETDVGSPYQWLGSTCGGRLPYETYGSCE